MKSYEILEVKSRPHSTVQLDVIVMNLSVRKPFTREQTLCAYCWTITRDAVVNFFHISKVTSELGKSD